MSDDTPFPNLPKETFIKVSAQEALGYPDSIDINVQPTWTDLEIYRAAMTIFPLVNDDWEYVSVVWDDDKHTGQLLIRSIESSERYEGDYTFTLKMVDLG